MKVFDKFRGKAMTVAYSKATLTLEQFLGLPETKPASEYLEGEILQKPMPQGQHSAFQAEITAAINQIGKTQKIVYAFPELRCTFAGISIVPDICVLKWANIPFEISGRVANRVLIPPDWIIEILSTEQSPLAVINKINSAIIHGSELGWLISPSQDLVMVFEGDRLPETKRSKDILPVLAGLDWQVSVDRLFSLLEL
jgi:Uma2 family endonuclease